MFTCVLGRYFVSTVLLVPGPFGGQLCGDNECPFSGGRNQSGRNLKQNEAQSARAESTHKEDRTRPRALVQNQHTRTIERGPERSCRINTQGRYTSGGVHVPCIYTHAR